MCRIFGFNSVIRSQVHSSLVDAENALGLQSQKHPDGWGVAYYLYKMPHLIKSPEAAFNDRIFKRVSGVVTSHTVVAHVRKATEGPRELLNTHPFQYGHWVFAHNGNIPNFSNVRNILHEEISDTLKTFILGETDSEIFFYFLLSKLQKLCGNLGKVTKFCVQKAIAQVIKDLQKLVGPLCSDPSQGPDKHYLSFIMTNGTDFYAFQGGQPLHYSTYKNKCGESNTCKFYSKTCEAPPKNGDPVQHILVSSEPVGDENVWSELPFLSLISVDAHRSFDRFDLQIT